MDLCLLNDTNVSNFVSDLPLFISSKFQKEKKNGVWSTGQEKKRDASFYINIQRQVIEIIIIIALRWETRWDRQGMAFGRFLKLMQGKECRVVVHKSEWYIEENCYLLTEEFHSLYNFEKTMVVFSINNNNFTFCISF